MQASGAKRRRSTDGAAAAEPPAEDPAPSTAAKPPKATGGKKGAAPTAAAPAAPATAEKATKPEDEQQPSTDPTPPAPPQQPRGAYSAREDFLAKQEEQGEIAFPYVVNDGEPANSVWLVGLKNVYSKQLPNMPREYIVRLLMDRRHRSVALVRRAPGAPTKAGFRPAAPPRAESEEEEGEGEEGGGGRKEEDKGKEGEAAEAAAAPASEAAAAAPPPTAATTTEKKAGGGKKKAAAAAAEPESEAGAEAPEGGGAAAGKKKAPAAAAAAAKAGGGSKKKAGTPDPAPPPPKAKGGKSKAKDKDKEQKPEAAAAEEEEEEAKAAPDADADAKAADAEQPPTTTATALAAATKPDPSSLPPNIPEAYNPASYGTVIGGITWRVFGPQRLGEIAFCAVAATEQVRGFGTRLMNRAKQAARDRDGVDVFLTYADNNAVGYFAKQGFVKGVVGLPKERWRGFVKDYDGGTLMHCLLHPTLPYGDLPGMVAAQRAALDARLRGLSSYHVVRPGLDHWKRADERAAAARVAAGLAPPATPGEAQAAEEEARPAPLGPGDVPGVKEAGWTAETGGYRPNFRVLLPAAAANAQAAADSAREKALADGASAEAADAAAAAAAASATAAACPASGLGSSSLAAPAAGGRQAEPTREALHALMAACLAALRAQDERWPFLAPVDPNEVPDYHDVIKDPVDLSLIARRVAGGRYYSTLEAFHADLRRMWANARYYNAPDSVYWRCAARLEAFADGWLSSHLVFFEALPASETGGGRSPVRGGAGGLAALPAPKEAEQQPPPA